MVAAQGPQLRGEDAAHARRAATSGKAASEGSERGRWPWPRGAEAEGWSAQGPTGSEGGEAAGGQEEWGRQRLPGGNDEEKTPYTDARGRRMSPSTRLAVGEVSISGNAW